MKKTKIVLLIAMLLFIGACSQEKGTPVSIPQCRVIEKSYFTNDPLTFDEILPDNYKHYGNVTYLDDEVKKNLSTNYKEYMDKEIYINQSDDTFVYMKYDENKFLKLYYDTEFRNK